MARKKKSQKKADPEEGGWGTDESAASPEAGGAGEKAEASKKKSAPKKKATPKKKRARKKAAKKADPASAEPTGDTEPAAADESAPPAKARKKSKATKPRAVLDLDEVEDGAQDVESLVAEAAILAEAAAGEREAIDAVIEAEPAPVQQQAAADAVDAVLDDDLDDVEDLDSLIAQTAMGASPEGQAEEETEEPPPAVLDEPLDEEPKADPAAAVPAPPASSRATSLAETAVRPAPDADIDLEGAIDLGPESSPELRDRLLAQAMAHAELQEARYRVPFSDPRRAGRWKGGVAAGLFLLAAVAAAAPPAWVRPEPPAQIDAAADARNVRAALLLQAQQVDAYRVRFQRLPESLDQLSAQLPGVRFVRSGNRAYQLIAYERDGGVVVYDSSNPTAEFGDLAPIWLAGAAP